MCYVIQADLEEMIADDEMSLEATEDHEVMIRGYYKLRKAELILPLTNKNNMNACGNGDDCLF